MIETKRNVLVELAKLHIFDEKDVNDLSEILRSNGYAVTVFIPKQEDMSNNGAVRTITVWE